MWWSGLSKEFSISESDIDRLKNATLGPGDCITINVTFKSSDVIGEFRTVARFYTNPEGCRDTSVWTARGWNLVGWWEGENGRTSASSPSAPNPGEGNHQPSLREPAWN